MNQKLTEARYSATALYLQTQTFTYDARGAMLTAQDPDGTYTFAYDDLGRTATVNEPFGLTLTYTYDAADNRTVVHDSKGGLETFAYDAAHRDTSLKFTGTIATISYGIDWTSRDQVAGLTRYSDATLTTKIGTTSFTYDSLGRLTHEQHKNGDTHGRLTQKQVDGTSTTYTHDNTDQLTQAGTATFGYDANGNRTNTGYTTGTGNQTTNDGTWTYTYDADGNRTKRSKGASLDLDLRLRPAERAHLGGEEGERRRDLAAAGGVRLRRPGQPWVVDQLPLWMECPSSNAFVFSECELCLARRPGESDPAFGSDLHHEQRHQAALAPARPGASTLASSPGRCCCGTDLQAFAAEVWRAETGRTDCPDVETFGPVGDEQGEASFRRLLHQMESHVRTAKNGLPAVVPAPATPSQNLPDRR